MGRSNALSQHNDTAIIKNVAPPKHNMFCFFAQEFHEERGLSLEGVDPQSLHGENDILDKEWNDVFTCPKPGPRSNKKVKAYFVKQDFVEALVHRHWDVYQEGPIMYEIGQQFAKAFSMENSPMARTSPKKEDYKICWALFAKTTMKSSEERHNLANKRKRWEEYMHAKSGQSNVHSWSFKIDDLSMGVQEPVCTQFVQVEKIEIFGMKFRVLGRLSLAKQYVEEAKNKA